MPLPLLRQVATTIGAMLAGVFNAMTHRPERVPELKPGDAAPAPAPRQQAANELPKTASPYSLIGLLGLLSLAGGFGLRLARATY